MRGHILVAFLKAVVLLDVVQVVSLDNGDPLHLGIGHHATQNPSSDGYITRKGECPVNIGALKGS